MQIVVAKFEGTSKITAIKAVREVFCMGLKEAKEAVENPLGIVMSRPVYNVLSSIFYSMDGKGSFVVVTDGIKPANPLGISEETMRYFR
jgi:hypothetical protein